MLQTNVIYCGECAAMMQQYIPDDSIDLTVTSPPYDNLRDYNGYVFEFEKIAQQLWRVTKPGGVVVWVVADATVNGSETGTSFRQALYFMGLGFNLHDTMIYKKTGIPYPEKTRYNPIFEFMFIFSKKSPKTVNLIKDKKNAYYNQSVARSHGQRQRNGSVIENSAYRIAKDRKIQEFGVRDAIWEYSTGLGNSGDVIAHDHPAQFPEALACDHIISWSNPGNIVLDPMCGSGTTLKMAVETGRRYIGIDISPEYCELSRQRVTCANIPLPGLLEPEPKKPEPEQLNLNNLG